MKRFKWEVNYDYETVRGCMLSQPVLRKNSHFSSHQGHIQISAKIEAGKPKCNETWCSGKWLLSVFWLPLLMCFERTGSYFQGHLCGQHFGLILSQTGQEKMLNLLSAITSIIKMQFSLSLCSNNGCEILQKHKTCSC